MTDQPWLSAREQEVWRAWLRLGHELPVALSRQLAECGQLSLPDYEVLVTLSEAENETLRVTDLAGTLNWERSRLSHQLRRMTERGQVARTDCPTDRRVNYISLTDAGRTMLEQAAPGHAAIVRELLFSDVDAAELAVVRQFLNRALSRLAQR